MFRIKVPQSVREGIHKLPHVQMLGVGAVIHDANGVSLYINPVPGTDEAEVTVKVDESIIEHRLKAEMVSLTLHSKK